MGMWKFLNCTKLEVTGIEASLVIKRCFFPPFVSVNRWSFGLCFLLRGGQSNCSCTGWFSFFLLFSLIYYTVNTGVISSTAGEVMMVVYVRPQARGLVV